MESPVTRHPLRGIPCVLCAFALILSGRRLKIPAHSLETPATLAIIAGNGAYPLLMARSARRAGVCRLAVAAFTNETDPVISGEVDEIEWMRVGQLGRLLGFLKKSGATHAVMSGQIHPKNLFDLRPDLKALVLLGKLRERNAESIFGAIAAEMTAIGVDLLPATSFMEEHLAPDGLIAGPKLSRREESDLHYGFRIAKATSLLDIGQTVVVKGGTVLAVEAFEGTNAAMKRGGELGRKDAVMVKVSKPRQDLRFDVPVIGPLTLEAAREARIRVLGVEAGQTLLLEREVLCAQANAQRISIFGLSNPARGGSVS
jgi:UDP-2,3-diacylglucosamine hydrolase